MNYLASNEFMLIVFVAILLLTFVGMSVLMGTGNPMTHEGDEEVKKNPWKVWVVYLVPLSIFLFLLISTCEH